MKKFKTIVGAATFASVFACIAPIAGAQEVTNPVNTEVNRDGDGGKWGLLGLVGLVGLLGQKRRDRDNHVHSAAGR